MKFGRFLSVGVISLLGATAGYAQSPFPNNSLERAAERLGGPNAPKRQTWDDSGPAGFSSKENDAKTQRLFEFLSKEYPRLMEKAKDRTSRGLILVCASRVPTDDMTKALLNTVIRDSDNVVKMVAWQAVLSRARYLTPEQYKQWVDATWPLVRAGAFNGMLRAPLVDMLATIPPDRNAKETFARIFANTNSTVYEDAEVLDALGKCGAIWKSPEVAEFLVNRMSSLDDAFRAQRALAAMGAPDALEKEGRRDMGSDQMLRLGVEEVVNWWKVAKPTWNETREIQGQPWRGLRAQFLPEPVSGYINADDPSWKKDLELRPPNMRSFDAAFVVDATGSMGPIIQWLHRDVKRLMKVFGMVSLEPRIGLTFYRDQGDAFITRSQPLTSSVDALLGELSQMTAKGGGDLPEAVFDGLSECMNKNAWVLNDAGKRVIILIGDAPPKPETMDKCVALVQRAAEKGLRLYAIKARTGYGADDLPQFDTLAGVGKGQSIWIDQWSGGQDAGKQVIEAVLVDAINPQYKERISPFVAVIWEMVSDGIPEVQKPFGPRKPPPPREHGGDHERRPPPTPKPPFDPQKQ